jgi:hypothetical protein
MRVRHTIVELSEDDNTPSFEFVEGMGGDDGMDEGGDLELIDESVAPQPILSTQLGTHAHKPAARPSGSAVPTVQPITQPKPMLAWGLGTDGWPRYNSRLVRLFACDSAEFTEAAAGKDWECLSLSPGWRLAKAKHRAAPGWPRLIDGTMQMPYRSPALAVQLQIQPFHDRYARVDIILKSRHRWPRHYFDVASICLTRMQRLERPLTLVS